MAEVLFYHLERQTLETTLPNLLEKCLEREWRVVVETSSIERCEALDALLWTYRDESFLPHGTWREAEVARHPVVLAAEPINPNRANVRFAVDGVGVGEPEGYDRVVVVFDGKDQAALDQARAGWKSARAGGHIVTYWQETPEGRWQKKG